MGERKREEKEEREAGHFKAKVKNPIPCDRAADRERIDSIVNVNIDKQWIQFDDFLCVFVFVTPDHNSKEKIEITQHSNDLVSPP